MAIISVILPAHNRQHTIERAIQSVLDQTFQDWELIVADDGSTDATVEVVQRYITEDGRIKHVATGGNRGAAAARNLAAQAASGKYIAFLDSDDRFLPTKLEKQLRLIEQLDPAWGGIYCGAIANLVNRGITREDLPVNHGDVYPKAVVFHARIYTPTLMVRSEIYRELGGMDERLRRHQDLDFFLRFSRKYKLAMVQEALVELFLFTNKSFRGTDIAAKELLYDRYFDEAVSAVGAKQAARAWATHWLSAASSLVRQREYASSLRYLKKAYSQHWCPPARDQLRYLVNLARSITSTGVDPHS